MQYFQYKIHDSVHNTCDHYYNTVFSYDYWYRIHYNHILNIEENYLKVSCILYCSSKYTLTAIYYYSKGTVRVSRCEPRQQRPDRRSSRQVAALQGTLPRWQHYAGHTGTVDEPSAAKATLSQ